MRRSDDALLREVAEVLAWAAQPDRSNVSDFGRPCGSAGRTAPVWESGDARLHEREPELRDCRTPKHDLEAVEFIRAVVTNDQAKLGEIADRPHNRAARSRRRP